MLDPLGYCGSLCRSTGPPTLATLGGERTPHMEEGMSDTDAERLSHLNRLWGGGVWEPVEHPKFLKRVSASLVSCTPWLKETWRAVLTWLRERSWYWRLVLPLGCDLWEGIQPNLKDKERAKEHSHLDFIPHLPPACASPSQGRTSWHCAFQSPMMAAPQTEEGEVQMSEANRNYSPPGWRPSEERLPISILVEQRWINLEIWMLNPGHGKILLAAKELQSITGQFPQGTV